MIIFVFWMVYVLSASGVVLLMEYLHNTLESRRIRKELYKEYWRIRCENGGFQIFEGDNYDKNNYRKFNNEI